MVSAVRIAPT
ncbi:unnamed protein product, partial [Diplocarpon coronariae]